MTKTEYIICIPVTIESDDNAEIVLEIASHLESEVKILLSNVTMSYPVKDYNVHGAYATLKVEGSEMS